MKVFVGWDQRDINAFLVLKHSLLKYATIPVEVIPIREYEMRAADLYWRRYHVCDGRIGPYGNGQMIDEQDGKPFSTGFSFSRFCVPLLNNYAHEWVLFMDADMMWRGDIAELVKLIDDQYSVMCVMHDYRPEEDRKMDGVAQERYWRKNWSSFMLMNTGKCHGLSKYAVNNWSGSDLHGMFWVEDHEIGELGPEWNFLCGHHDPDRIDPVNVHFTRGTPDMGWTDEPFADEWIENFKEADANIIIDRDINA